MAEGKSPGEVRQVLEVSEATHRRWRNRYEGMTSGEAERLKEQELENARLKRIMAQNDLEIDMLMQIAAGNQGALPASGPRPSTRQILPGL